MALNLSSPLLLSVLIPSFNCTRQSEEALNLWDSFESTSKQRCPAAEEKMNPVVFRRARHVISEIKRTEEAAEALLKRKYDFFGKLMVESHESLRDDYEVSCKEVDQLVDLAMEFGKKNKDCVLGCRMTGAGFGGCCVALVHKNSINDLIKYLQSNYQGSAPTFYEAFPSGGARILTPM